MTANVGASHFLRWPYSFIHMDYLGRRETIEPGRRGVAVGADVFRIHQVIDLQRRQFFRERDRVERITGLTEDRAYFRLPLFERLQMILAMIENNAAERVVDA